MGKSLRILPFGEILKHSAFWENASGFCLLGESLRILPFEEILKDFAFRGNLYLYYDPDHIRFLKRSLRIPAATGLPGGPAIVRRAWEAVLRAQLQAPGALIIN